MNYRTISAMVAILAGAVSTPALAEDRPDDFNGPYIAISGGLASRSGDTADTVVFDTNRDGTYGDTVRTSGGADAFAPGFCNGSSTLNSMVTTPCTSDQDKFEYAARLGYDKRFGNMVGGLLIEGAGNNSTDSSTAFSSTPAGYSFTRGIDYSISARARVGYTPGGRGLFYVTGGGSYAKINHTFTTTNAVNSFTPVNPDKMVWGYQGGAGAEILLGKNLTVGMEYLYNNYTDDKYFVAIRNGIAGPTNAFVLAGGVNFRPSDTSYDFHSFRATLGFRF